MHHIDILPAVEADIPRLAQIHVHAFREDLAIRLRFSGDEEHYDCVVTMIEKQIQDPKTLVTVAIEASTGRIIAFAIWLQFDGTEKEEPLPPSQHLNGGGRTMSEVIAQSSRSMRARWMMGKKYTRSCRISSPASPLLPTLIADNSSSAQYPRRLPTQPTTRRRLCSRPLRCRASRCGRARQLRQIFAHGP